ncbi:Bromodomain and PHD finger-containing protein 1 [Blyttiomyces sp. JEL0837]|nr:Bromodomain and PHD finger-containing protein 1 [Blyttiomyces sp. JEL0837]
MARRKSVGDDAESKSSMEEDEKEESSDEEDDGICEICGGHGTLVLCDGKNSSGEVCNLSVHLKCYRPGTQLPQGDWLCDRCLLDNAGRNDLKVVCCNSPKRAIRKTSTPGAYIHAICALWNPAVGLGPGESTIKIDNNLLTAGKPCSFCRKSVHSGKGLRLKCNRSDCLNVFHATCCTEAKAATPSRARSAKGMSQLLVCETHSKESESKSRKRRREVDRNVDSDDRNDLDYEDSKPSEDQSSKVVNADGDDSMKTDATIDENDTKPSKDINAPDQAKRLKTEEPKREATPTPASTTTNSRPSTATAVKPGANVAANRNQQGSVPASKQIKEKPPSQRMDDTNEKAGTGGESYTEALNRICNSQDKLTQELKTLIPSLTNRNTPKPQPPPQKEKDNSLDALLDQSFEKIAKSEKDDEIKALRFELRQYQQRLAMQEASLSTLRGDLVAIFNHLKLTAKVPEDARIDEYVSTLKTLLLRQ